MHEDLIQDQSRALNYDLIFLQNGADLLSMKRILLLAVSLATLSSSVKAAESSYASKLTLRTGIGQMNNQGTLPSSSGANGGFALIYTHFLTEKLTAGLGYEAQFDISGKTMPLWGYDMIGRYYFGKSGTRVKSQDEWSEITHQPAHASYFAVSYSKRDYFLGDDLQSTTANAQIRGDTSSARVALGLDYHLSGRFEANVEGIYSFLVFSASDPRYRLQASGIYFGLNYVF